jgi:hypothetical protein
VLAELPIPRSGVTVLLVGMVETLPPADSPHAADDVPAVVDAAKVQAGPADPRNTNRAH